MDSLGERYPSLGNSQLKENKYICGKLSMVWFWIAVDACTKLCQKNWWWWKLLDQTELPACVRVTFLFGWLGHGMRWTQLWRFCVCYPYPTLLVCLCLCLVEMGCQMPILNWIELNIHLSLLWYPSPNITIWNLLL